MFVLQHPSGCDCTTYSSRCGWALHIRCEGNFWRYYQESSKRCWWKCKWHVTVAPSSVLLYHIIGGILMLSVNTGDKNPYTALFNVVHSYFSHVLIWHDIWALISYNHRLNLYTHIPLSVQAALYGMAQSIPDRSLVGELAWCYLDAMYSTKQKSTKAD